MQNPRLLRVASATYFHSAAVRSSTSLFHYGRCRASAAGALHPVRRVFHTAESYMKEKGRIFILPLIFTSS